MAAVSLTVAKTDPQAEGKCINQFNCPEIQHHEHPKVSYTSSLLLAFTYLVTFTFFLKLILVWEYFHKRRPGKRAQNPAVSDMFKVSKI